MSVSVYACALVQRGFRGGGVDGDRPGLIHNQEAPALQLASRFLINYIKQTGVNGFPWSYGTQHASSTPVLLSLKIMKPFMQISLIIFN